MCLPCRILFLRRTEVGVDNERHLFPIAVVAKFETPVALARQLNGAVVALLAVHFVQLQFFARIEVTETPVNRKIFLSLFLFTVFF